MKTFDQPGVAADVYKRLEALQAHSSRRWGKMTPHQAVCHLRDSLKSAIGERERRTKPAPVVRQAVMKWFALYLPVPWPQGVQTMPENDQLQQGTPPLEFARDKAELVALAQRVATQPAQWVSHPLFGSLTQREWQRWVYLHFDHHLRQFGV